MSKQGEYTTVLVIMTAYKGTNDLKFNISKW